MILISTLRKMIQKNRNATVVRITVNAYKGKLGDQGIDVPASVEYFVTDRQAGLAQMHHAGQCALLGANPANLIHVCGVPANEAAIAQGFDFLRSN